LEPEGTWICGAPHGMKSYMGDTAKVITSTVKSGNRFTIGHQRRVAELACAIAQEMGLTSDQIHAIHIAGLVHDIGKACVPMGILIKPGRLDETEFSLVVSHCQAGYDMLKGVRFPWPVADIVLQHHERMNGSGYPSGMCGDEISIEARILGVADVVEAMTSHRPYRAALDIEKAMDELLQNSGILYDPDVVCTCIKLFADKGFAFEE